MRMAMLQTQAVKLMSSIQSKFECIFQGSTNRRLIGSDWFRIFEIILGLDFSTFRLIRGFLVALVDLALIEVIFRKILNFALKDLYRRPR